MKPNAFLAPLKWVPGVVSHVLAGCCMHLRPVSHLDSLPVVTSWALGLHTSVGFQMVGFIGGSYVLTTTYLSFNLGLIALQARSLDMLASQLELPVV